MGTYEDYKDRYKKNPKKDKLHLTKLKWLRPIELQFETLANHIINDKSVWIYLVLLFVSTIFASAFFLLPAQNSDYDPIFAVNLLFKRIFVSESNPIILFLFPTIAISTVVLHYVGKYRGQKNNSLATVQAAMRIMSATVSSAVVLYVLASWQPALYLFFNFIIYFAIVAVKQLYKTNYLNAIISVVLTYWITGPLVFLVFVTVPGGGGSTYSTKVSFINNSDSSFTVVYEKFYYMSNISVRSCNITFPKGWEHGGEFPDYDKDFVNGAVNDTNNTFYRPSVQTPDGPEHFDIIYGPMSYGGNFYNCKYFSTGLENLTTTKQPSYILFKEGFMQMCDNYGVSKDGSTIRHVVDAYGLLSNMEFSAVFQAPKEQEKDFYEILKTVRCYGG